MQKNTVISAVMSIAIIVGILYVVTEKPATLEGDGVVQYQNVEIKDGIQYVTIHARGGYTPRVSTAQADIPTKLIIKTNGTYDCSVALVIRSIGYQKVLPQTGEEIIDLGTPQAETLQGLCGMGMYNFSVNFR